MTLALYRGLIRTTCLIEPRPLVLGIQRIPTRDYCSPSGNKDEQSNSKSGTAASGKIARSRENVKVYMFGRFFDHVKNYDKLLEKNFPAAAKVYRVFFDGVKEFYSDMKRFVKVTRIANTSPNGLKALNRKELELYMQMPKDMIKVAPVLVFSSLPMIGSAVFPIAYWYPRIFLTSHFWTLQQKSEFQQFYLTERLSNNRAVLRCLQSNLKQIKKDPLHTEMDNVLGLIGSGFHPSVDSLLNVKDVFTRPPYTYDSLSGKHIKYLCHIHGLRSGLFKRHRLYEHAFIIHSMDIAITREGGVHNMPADALRYACYIRGLNPVNMSNEDLIEWLRDWVKVSLAIQEEHISLFLHLPLFLAYNHPNNWKLIYSK